MRHSIVNTHLRKGAALLLVLFIAFASIVAMMGLFGLMAPRQFAVKGGAVSDRALSMADAGVDRVVELINLTGLSFSTPKFVNDTSTPETDRVTKMIITQLLAGINGDGGSYDPNNSTPSYVDAMFVSISQGVRRYFYNVLTNQYYRLDSGDVASGTITNLSTNTSTLTGGLYGASGDALYLTNNLWFEMDTNASYHLLAGSAADTWELKVTSFNLASPTVKRTIKALVNRGDVAIDAGTTPAEELQATGDWYEWVTTPTTTEHTFSDFSGLFHFEAYFGKLEVTQGMIRSDSNLHMGGWAKDPVYATGTVSGDACDDGYANDGQFGVNANDSALAGGNVAWAKATAVGPVKFANDNYPTAEWGNGLTALSGTQGYRNPADPNGGMQDVAGAAYYVNGNATVEFGVDTSVTPNVGRVRFDGGSWLAMPSNGIIYVEGDATVLGTVLGRATVGAGNDVLIGGNIVYSQPPRIDKNTSNVGIPDSLGLVAERNIMIPTSTYNANLNLRVDAAMMAVTGWFGIDPNASSHSIDETPHHVAYWNGAQAVWAGGRAPAMVNGSQVAGYEVQHTLFDNNLLDVGPPPMYPVSDTSETTISKTTLAFVGDSALQTYLHGLKKADLQAVDPGAADYDAQKACYKVYYSGKWYYYGPSFNVKTTYESWAQADWNPNAVSLYRVAWKEQIAQPVVP